MKQGKKMLIVFALMPLMVLATERIIIDGVTNHYPWDGKVDCVTTLSGLDNWHSYKGAFTLLVKKEGETLRRIVTNEFAIGSGTYTNTFDCTELFGAGFYPNGGITVDLVRSGDNTGTPIGIIGDVLLIDVSDGSSAETYPTMELTNVDMGTFNCDAYKTDKIVLRKVSAGSYYCQPRDYYKADTVVTQKLATIGFYIGIFPVTQRQYELVMGVNPSDFKTDSAGNDAAQRPVERVSWNTIRGSVAAETAITASSADSFLKRLVVKTGLSGFDLPTEAQWEMACRAGSTVEYGACWSDSSSVTLTSLNLGEAAWYDYNSSSITHAVGGKKSNLWGLYDMQGNVWEWCRDIVIHPYNAEYVDIPCAEKSYLAGADRVYRGGSWYYNTGDCRPSARFGNNANIDGANVGFRLSRTLP